MRAVPVVAWLAFACANVAAGAPVLPKYGVSVSVQGDQAAEVKAARDCGAKDRTVMLPPISARLGVAANDAERRAAIASLASSLPAGDDVFVRLRLDLSGLTQVGPQEKVIIAQVADVTDRLPLAAPTVRGVLIEIEGDLPPADLVQFALAQLTVKAKAAKTGLRVVFSFPAGFVQAHTDLIAKLGVYADAIGTVFAAGWEAEMNKAAELALNKPVFLKIEGELAPEQVASRFLDAVTAASGTSVEVVWVEQPGAPAISHVCTTGNFLAGFLTKDFTPMAPALAPFSITSGGRPAGPQKLFADGRTPNVAMLVKPGGSPANPITLDMRGNPGEQFDMEWYDPISGARLTPGAASKSPGGIGQSGVAQSDYLFLLMRKVAAPGQRVYGGVEVSEKIEITADEVIARWQQYKEAQRQALANYTGTCLMTIHFDSNALGAGFDVSMLFKQFAKRDQPTEWAQTEFYVNGVRFRKRTEFPLPQLEPEKVLTQPLELKLNEKYKYKLLGTETVDGVNSYVVGVEPIEQNENLYSGKIWVDTETFRQVRGQLSQRSAKGSILSNQETQKFALVPDGQGHQFNLLKSIYAQQTVNAAGRAFILEKTYAFSDYAINTAGFDGALTAVRQSDDPMFRDTEAGLRSLRKKAGERIEQPAGQKRVKSIVGGVLYEGTFDFPIPLLGYSLVDFDFRHSGSQLSLFWAGPIFAANLSKQRSQHFGLSVDVVANGLPSQNRVYNGNTEDLTQGVWKWGQSVGFRATWQPTNDLSITGAAYMDYNFYRRTSDTDKGFVLPANGPEAGPFVEIKWAKKGFIFTGQFNEVWRVGWHQFGMPGNQQPAEKFFTKYSGDFAKNFFFGKFQKSTIDLSYYSGEHMDRFSRYSPSFFSSPRVRGIPSGVDTFDTIAVASIAHGFNVADLIKFEGSYNHAWAKNREQSQSFRAYDGLDFSTGTAGPWGTYVQGIFTYALKGDLQRYNRRFGVYLLIFRPFH